LQKKNLFYNFAKESHKEKMNRFYFTIILLSTICVNISAQYFAAVTAAQQTEILAKIQTASEKMTSLSCNFVQEKTASILTEQSAAKGKMYYRNDNKLRWEYTSPFANAVIMNGKKMAMQTEKGKTNVSGGMTYLFRGIADIMMSGISGKGLTDSKRFKINVLSNGKSVKVQMIPLQTQVKKAFTEIAIVFNTADYAAETVVLHDAQGGVTTITLTDKQFNKAIDDKLFNIN
jgi:outer membrane lipoprotein carrier protein